MSDAPPVFGVDAGINYIDLFFIHDVSTWSEYEQIVNEGVYEFCLDARSRGRIGHVSMSTHDPCPALEIGSSIEDEIAPARCFAAVMPAYNVRERSIEDEILSLARKQEIGVVNMKPFGRGVLCGEQGRQYGIEAAAGGLLRFIYKAPANDACARPYGSVPAESARQAPLCCKLNHYEASF